MGPAVVCHQCGKMRPAEAYIPCESCGALRPGASPSSAFGASPQFGGGPTYGSPTAFGSPMGNGGLPPATPPGGSSTKTILLVVAGISACALFSCCGFLGFAGYQGYREQAARQAAMMSPTTAPANAPAASVIESRDRLIVVPQYGGLVMTTELHQDAQLQAQNPSAELYVLGFSEAKSAFAPGFTLGQYGSVVTQNMNVEAKVLTAPVPVTVGGRPAQQYRIHGTLNNLPIAYWIVVVETEQHFHQLVLWTLGTMEAQHTSTIDQIVRESVVRSTL